MPFDVISSYNNQMQICERVKLLNDCQPNTRAQFVLYWMQMYKRVDNNHALNFAIERGARE
jgi:hypothetical protein